MQDDGENARRREETLAYFVQRAYSYGAEFFVDGEAVRPDEVLQRTVREEDTYMADYILNDDGGIAQVRFDKVKGQ